MRADPDPAAPVASPSNGEVTGFEPLVQRDLGWVDVFVDLRGPEAPAPPEQAPSSRHIVNRAGARVVGSWDHDGTATLWWRDADGFTAAVAGTLGNHDSSTGYRHGLKAVFPLAAHLCTSRSVMVRRYREQDLFFAHLPALSALVADEAALLEPVPQTRARQEHAAFRLGWAGLGRTVREVPAVLRDTALIREPLVFGQRPRRVLPYGLCYRYPRDHDWFGLEVAARWLAHGFGLDEAAEWAQLVTTYAPVTKPFAAPVLALVDDDRLDAVARLRGLGFDMHQAAEWAIATQVIDEVVLGTEHIARLRDAEHDPHEVGLLTNEFDWTVNRTARDFAAFVDGWLAVCAPQKAALYVAAGMTLAEATAMEDSGEAPDLATLEVLAALRAPSRA